MTFRFCFVSRDCLGPGSVTGTCVGTEFCLGLRRRRFSASSLAIKEEEDVM
jgi:hypothetical protein